LDLGKLEHIQKFVVVFSGGKRFLGDGAQDLLQIPDFIWRFSFFLVLIRQRSDGIELIVGPSRN